MADTRTSPWQAEQRVVSYAQWQSVWRLVQECEALLQHWQERVSGLRRALRNRTLAGGERAECQTVLREAVGALHQARATLSVLKIRLLRGCTVCGPNTQQ